MKFFLLSGNDFFAKILVQKIFFLKKNEKNQIFIYISFIIFTCLFFSSKKSGLCLLFVHFIFELFFVSSVFMNFLSAGANELFRFASHL